MSRDSIRWWPAVLILLLAVLGYGAVWGLGDGNRQDQVLSSFAIGAGAILLLLLWLLFASRARWTLRLGGLLLLALVVALPVMTMRLRGVSGDLVPQWEWRWAGAPRATTGAGGVDDPIEGASFPGFLGPAGDGRLSGIGLDPDWKSSPPRELWRIPVGEGWSGFAVTAGRAVTQEQHGDEERVICYDLETGALLWAHVDTTRWEDALGGPGPRATPAIDRGRVYALGATGLLNVLDLETGHRIWSRNVLTDQGASPPAYGVSSSPRVIGETVVVMAGGRDGGSLAAYGLEDGEPRWSAGDDGAGYSTPSLHSIHGVPQILVLTDDHVAAHGAEDGTLLWSAPWPGETQKVANPVVLPGDRVVASSGYGVGAKAFRIDRDGDTFRVETLWESRALKAKFSNFVHHEGHLYGLDDGILTCVDAADGARRWKRGRYGHGQLLLVDDLLLIATEGGDVVLVEADPAGHSELARISALRSKCWNNPALAGSRLIVRNDREAVAFALPLR